MGGGEVSVKTYKGEMKADEMIGTTVGDCLDDPEENWYRTP